MQKISPDQVKELIAAHPDIVEFGTAEAKVDEVWIGRAEERIGLKLTESYKWFLRNYAHGEIFGDEIYSLYGEDFDTIQGGDIVANYLRDLKSGMTDPGRVPICITDFAETFYFEYTEYKDGECPIYLMHGVSRIEPYAGDFYEFLYRYITDNIK